MNYYPYDSQNSIYKSNIGAAASGTTLKLRLLLHTAAHVHDAYLRIRNDNSDFTDSRQMFPCSQIEDYVVYECSLSLDEGLYWYDFVYTSDFGTYFVKKTNTSLGVYTNEDVGPCWQQTVYENGFTTPDWLRGGIIYQIFPDRFYNSGAPKTDIPSDRYICEDWSAQPEYRQSDPVKFLGNDYYGGDLKGICEKLPYLKSLGVSCIYMNPIFEAHSNHRYNTADYSKIDPLLGNEEDLKKLCREAKKLGIAVILDGVFSHTGDDSVYFNRKGRYAIKGAYNDYNSPYHSWFKFDCFPDKYSSWWGIETLPETIEDDPSFTDFITGENGIIRKWLRCGISGWRLDVADELPDAFLDNLRSAMKSEKADSYLLGEVWEDATNKISYGYRRRFLRGRQLDSVMNYPFANAIIDFVRGADAKYINRTVLDILENYPPQATALLMNHIGTHDTPRALTALARYDNEGGNREWQSHQKLSAERYSYAVKLLKLAAAIQYTLPGVPSLYYGDEAGVEGYGDPFCRSTYPWGHEDTDLLEFYKSLGGVRRNCKAFLSGDYIPHTADGGIFAFERKGDGERAFIAINRCDEQREIYIPEGFENSVSVLGVSPDGTKLTLPPKSFSIITM